MKKLIVLLSLLSFSIGLFAQSSSDNTLKFLGIPVDGPKSNMMTALKNKGFKYNTYKECFTGQFNGEESEIYIVDYNGKVNRVFVCDQLDRDEADIIIRFNSLLSQFRNNGKYIDLGDNKAIPSTENISYEITVKHKRYEADFCLKNNPNGVVWFTILENYGDYQIGIYYDNLLNQAHGEDL